ncbi:ATP phosphoribosyltransferase regulatory subunit [Striga asiatica]|uniref:ATP phosphoribosyltransferase regulatory subunit n=1 Tax=Striga asiatica TaxID=4170 RepID=A0A5A7P0B1_STRAF|nr:ATP phosphoribosyltransferase regulatory subunit [Striga asiatica]
MSSSTFGLVEVDDRPWVVFAEVLMVSRGCEGFSSLALQVTLTIPASQIARACCLIHVRLCATLMLSKPMRVSLCELFGPCPRARASREILAPVRAVAHIPLVACMPPAALHATAVAFALSSWVVSAWLRGLPCTSQSRGRALVALSTRPLFRRVARPGIEAWTPLSLVKSLSYFIYKHPYR